MKKVLFFLFVLSISFDSSAQISKIEKKIVSSVDSNNSQALKLLEEVVNINSGSMNFEGVFKVGQIFKAKLDALGFETHWVDGKSFGRAGHLVGYHTSKGTGKTLLLIGHLDTVFEPSSSFQKFTMVNDSTATGPGVSDMKGGDVMIIYSLEALRQAGLLKNMNIIVVMTGDEELSGRPLELARKDLIEAAKNADIALGMEDGDSNPTTGVISRRSSSGWELNVNGLSAHSSQIFTTTIGAGAIYEASRILTGFYESLSTEKDLTFNPGMILGGSDIQRDNVLDGGSAFGKGNIVAKQAVVTGDIRAISPEQLKRAQEVMQRVVDKHLPQTNATLTFDEGYPPLAPTDGNKKLLEYYTKVSEDLGLGKVTAVNPRDAGAADISFTAGYVDMAIDGLGLFGGHGHTDKEYANLNWLPKQTKRIALLMYRLTQNPISNKK
ncbi:MAG TPA: M20/M25/M40 family metallo-hydrolase [Cyclobacteriaceae bacterium]|nr:M20/M25/M40 family metallo-hydrolase [Cyclobacteriaceae bacterium]